MGIGSINVSVNATAAVASTSAYYCVMAINPTAQASLKLTGNATITITAPNCVVQVSSQNSDAVDLTGNTSINSVENCFVGGMRTASNSSVSPSPYSSFSPMPDPF